MKEIFRKELIQFAGKVLALSVMTVVLLAIVGIMWAIDTLIS